MTTAIVLAGGLGTRLRSAVPDLPKPMAPINGRPFLEYQLDYWIKQGVNHFVLSVGYRHEIIIEHFGNRYNGAKLDYVIEENSLGTGGGLLLAYEKVPKEESFLLLNGDTFFEVELTTLIEFSIKNDADWCFSLFPTDEKARYMGMTVSGKGRIISLKGKKSGQRSLVNGGVYWVNPRSLLNEEFSPGDKVSLEDDFFISAIIDQRMFGIVFTGTFIDIGVPEDYYRAQALLAQ